MKLQHACIVFALATLGLLGGRFAAAAEPCLLVYPAETSVYWYDPFQYAVIGQEHDLYDPVYSVSGQMLWDQYANRVALEVYQAPAVVNFQPNATAGGKFIVTGSQMSLVIDGFSESPRQLGNMFVEFKPFPNNATVLVNGAPVTSLRYAVPRLVVSTPTASGFYSDTITLDVACSQAARLEMVVFQDRNGNRVFDGEPCYSVILENATVPVEEHTWGGVKSVFEGE